MDPAQGSRIVEDLARRLAARGERRPLSDLRPFGSGHSGFTYSVRLGEEQAVLRLSPPGVRIAGPTDVGLQGRVMVWLHHAGAPAPEVIDCSSEPVIDDRAFVLMAMARGTSWAHARTRLGDAAVARAAVTALLTIQRAARGAPGIAGLSAFPAVDEVERWANLAARVPQELGAPLARLRDQLVATAPADDETCLVHGDFHYGNLLFADGRVTAVFDWEIASVGDPLVDLACLAVASHRRRYAPEPNPTGDVDVSPGFVAGLAGADPTRFAWFFAQCCFKYAVIIGFNLELHRRGRRELPIYESLQRTMVELPADGLAVLDRGLAAVEPEATEAVPG